jgi:hypothetical protein
MNVISSADSEFPNAFFYGKNITFLRLDRISLVKNHKFLPILDCIIRHVNLDLFAIGSFSGNDYFDGKITETPERYPGGSFNIKTIKFCDSPINTPNFFRDIFSDESFIVYTIRKLQAHTRLPTQEYENVLVENFPKCYRYAV